MIKITSRETGEQITLEQCAKEHGMEVELSELYICNKGSGWYILGCDVGYMDWVLLPFDSSRFKLEISE